jgi:hypothetical protein
LAELITSPPLFEAGGFLAMKARLLSAVVFLGLLTAFCANSFAQGWRWVYPDTYDPKPLEYQYSQPNATVAQPWVIPDHKAIYDVPENVLREIKHLLDTSGLKLVPATEDVKQLLLRKVKELPQIQKDIPHFDLPQDPVDSEAIFHTPDITSNNSSSARWYGRNLEPHHDYDPYILWHGHESARDTGIIIHNLMLWNTASVEVPTAADTSGMNLPMVEVPTVKIDTSAFSKYRMLVNPDLKLNNDGIMILPDGSLQGSINIPYNKNYSMPNAGGRITIDPGMIHKYDSPKPKGVKGGNIWLIDSNKK